MRGTFPLLLTLLLAGCAAPEAAQPSATADPALPDAPPEPHHASGTLWLAPSQGQERVRTNLTLPVAAAGMRVEATLHLGSRMMGIDLPASIADVQAQLVDPAGTVAAKATLRGDAPDATLLVPAAPSAGAWQLVLLSYGGSDGAENGDHVDYAVAVASSQEARA